MIARPLPSRDGRPIGLRIGGFNLLPYRQSLSRGRRRRLIAESAAAVLVGALAALAWTGWDHAFGESGSTRRRAELEASLAGFAAPLAEYRQLERAGAQAAERAAVAVELAKPRVRLLGVVETLSRTPLPAVMLRRLKLTGKGLELDATAADAPAATAWVDRLARAEGIHSAEITDWRLAAGGGAPYAVEIAARLRWENDEAAGASAGGGDSRRRRR